MPEIPPIFLSVFVMKPISSPRPLLMAFGLLMALLNAGCITIGEGITEREFDAGLEGLTPGMTQEQVLTTLGEPRERRPAVTADDHDAVWVYSRFEVVGTRTVINEGAIGGGGAGIPTYQDEDVTAVVRFNLEWKDGELVRWERIEP